MELCCTRGAAAYGLLNTTTLTGIASVLGPVLNEELKVIDRKGKKGQILEEEDLDVAHDPRLSDDEEDGDDDDGPVAGSSKSSRPGDNGLTLLSLKSLVHDFSKRSNLFKQCPDEHPAEMLLDSLIGVAYLAAMKPKFADIDILPVIYTYGSLSERNLMITCRSLISGLTITGRDHRMLDSSKAKSNCHKAAVRILVYFVKRLPHITTEWTKKRGDDDRLTPAAKAKRVRKPGSRLTGDSTDPVLSATTPKSADAESLPFPSAYVCVVGALQRMILVVPDRAPTRSVAVESALSIVSTLTETYECCTGKERSSIKSIYDASSSPYI